MNRKRGNLRLPVGYTFPKIDRIFEDVFSAAIRETRGDEVTLTSSVNHCDHRRWSLVFYGTFNGREFYKRIDGDIADLSTDAAMEQFHSAQWQQLMFKTIFVAEKLDR